MNLTAEHITMKFGKRVTALCDVSFSIPGGIFGLIGRNGAGKTTLMRIMATVCDPTNGRILADGKPVSADFPAFRKKLGYLPQNTRLMPYLSLTEFLDYSCVIKGITDPNQRKSEIARCISAVGLEHEGKKRLSKYSGGMLRRAGIAQALLGDPELLIIDEPTAGLDPEERLYFLNLLSKMGREKTVVFSTHIIRDIENLCPSIAILEKGRLIYTGDVTALLSTLSNRTFEAELSPGTEEKLKAPATITGITYVSGRPRVRYVCDEPILPGSLPVTPGLEDAYVCTLGGIRRQ